MSIIAASGPGNSSQEHPADQTLSPPRMNALVSLLHRTVWLNGLFVLLLVSNLFFPDAPDDDGTKRE